MRIYFSCLHYIIFSVKNLSHNHCFCRSKSSKRQRRKTLGYTVVVSVFKSYCLWAGRFGFFFAWIFATNSPVHKAKLVWWCALANYSGSQEPLPHIFSHQFKFFTKLLYWNLLKYMKCIAQNMRHIFFFLKLFPYLHPLLSTHEAEAYGSACNHPWGNKIGLFCWLCCSFSPSSGYESLFSFAQRWRHPDASRCKGRQHC